MGEEACEEGEEGGFRVSWWVCFSCFSWDGLTDRMVLLDDAHAARRRYKKDLDLIKPDLEEYNKQKAIAMGYAPGALVGFNTSAATSASALQVRATSSQSFFFKFSIHFSWLCQVKNRN